MNFFQSDIFFWLNFVISCLMIRFYYSDSSALSYALNEVKKIPPQKLTETHRLDFSTEMHRLMQRFRVVGFFAFLGVVCIAAYGYLSPTGFSMLGILGTVFIPLVFHCVMVVLCVNQYERSAMNRQRIRRRFPVVV